MPARETVLAWDEFVSIVRGSVIIDGLVQMAGVVAELYLVEGPLRMCISQWRPHWHNSALYAAVAELAI
jgi:hypothetical protein